ncbi:MAG: tetratricopeptide repeat protein [Flavobacteriales bacterium]|nr:tetratricopeptide repeat protein [Flavobacteriales bacterium]MBK9076368.1 tetratricopeptide repeat protein [Flavobacteriales bacterium]MBK9539424.1 tetratricopeptide repeat protein [Flavobacteriales bacterium]
MAEQWWLQARYWLLFPIHIGMADPLVGQSSSTLDSLIAQLDTARRDTLELFHLSWITNILYEDPRGAPYLHRYGTLAEELSGSHVPAIAEYAQSHQTNHLNLYALDQMTRQNFVVALRTFEQALALHTARGNANGIALMYNNIGWLNENTGDPARAITNYKEALKLVRTGEVSNLHASAVLSHIGSLFTDMGALDSAEVYLQHGLAGTDSLSFAHDHLCMGRLRAAQGRNDEALRHLIWARDATDKDHNHQLFFAVLSTMGQVYSAMNEPALLAAVVEERVRRARESGNDMQLSKALIKRGMLRRENGEWVGAEDDLRTALSIARNNGYLADVVAATTELRALYAARGNYKGAYDMMVEMTAAADSMRGRDARKEVFLREFRAELASDSLASVQKAERVALEHTVQMGRERTRRNIFLFAGLGLLVFAVVVFRQRARIRKALERSDELLLNILPAEVAEELKEKGETAARHFDTATILFTDFKGFTQMSEQVTPSELVAELNICFKAFDHIITARGIEKIKTIGDAYMAAGGLPDPASSTPADVVFAALEMQDFMQKHKAERETAGKPFFEMRVGIHSGPVVAGIVGVKKFQYDIWGDTVNTASRMESSGEVGQVNISESTYRLVVGDRLSVVSSRLSVGSPTTDNQQLTTGPAFTFTPRGKVQAKGKGELEMYFVTGKSAVAQGYGG